MIQAKTCYKINNRKLLTIIEYLKIEFTILKTASINSKYNQL